MGAKSAVRFLLALVWAPALFYTLAMPLSVAAAPPSLPAGEEVDYLIPPAGLTRATAAVRVLGASASGPDRVEYTSMASSRFTLNRFAGRHVDLLLPDGWLRPETLGHELARALVDRADLLYEHYRELAGEEPGPADRRLPIAIVASTCGAGCGYVGGKGIEVRDDTEAVRQVREALAAGLLPQVVVHEMGHNFDFNNGFVRDWTDSAHAWTSFIELYLPAFSRAGAPDLAPEEALRAGVEGTFGRYLANAALTWDSCFAGTRCTDGMKNRAWAGTLWKLAELRGPDAVTRYLAFLRQAKADGVWPLTLAEKNDLHVEALAAGAQLDLGCAVDAWRWRASTAVRERMAILYGPGTDLCQDGDADGASPVAGDCDDADPGRRPGAVEVVAGLDDDCDGRVDELRVTEPTSGDFPALQDLALPGEARGAIRSGDADRFAFDLGTSGRVRIDLCSRPDFQGWLFLQHPGGGAPGLQRVERGGCSSRGWALPAGEHTFSLELNTGSLPGGYEVAVSAGAPWPAPAWAAAMGSRLCSGALTLSATPASPLPVEPAAVRFWVSGLGFVGAAPAAPWSAVRWTPPAGFAPADLTGRTFRAQLVAAGAPVSDVTPPVALPPPTGPCETAAITVQPPAGGLGTREDGTSAQLTIGLTSRPTAPVAMPVRSSDPTEGTVSPASLTFTPESWAPKTVTVTGVDDAALDGDVAYSVVIGRVTSTDPAYAGVDPADAAAVNQDDDVAPSRAGFYTVAPCRLLDTREVGQGPALASGARRIVAVAGRCGVPATARAIAANVTITGASSDGHLALYPGDAPPASTSTINFRPDQTRANNALVPLAADGSGTLAIDPMVFGDGAVHAIVDVSGYFE